jgi:hypothetical protein
VAWATSAEVTRGFINISDITAEYDGSNRASAGVQENAIGQVGNGIVSLGDSGIAMLTFNKPITNGTGSDFAVFENGFSHTFLELAHVEVSSDGINYVRFPSHSETQTNTQVGGFGAVQATSLQNLAGKYKAGFGTPFDLEELKDSADLNVEKITHIKIIDAVGTIGAKGTLDSYGNKINDPFPTPFASCGFDLDGVGVINEYNSVNLSTEELSFNVYPNPSQGNINIQMNNTNAKELIITNSLGKQVAQVSISNKNAPLQFELSQGIYFVHVKGSDKIASRKVVIQ